MSTTPRPLAMALAKIMSEIKRIEKDGRNDFHKYDYATEAAIVDGVRGLLSEQGVAIFPSVVEHETIDSGRNGQLATVTLELTFIHGESGDIMTTRWVGQGVDKGDKAYYKAYTGAMKYALMKTFLISTGDDPEVDSPEVEPQRRPSRKQTTKAKPNKRVKDAPPRSTKTPQQDFRDLVDECVEAHVASHFQGLYAQGMGAEDIGAVEVKKLKSMCTKLRGMNIKLRREYIESIVSEATEA